jgi:hypothetical protein
MVLDSLHLAFIFLSGSHVSPVLTVTLTHLTVPLIVTFAQFSRYGGACTCFRGLVGNYGGVEEFNDLNNEDQHQLAAVASSPNDTGDACTLSPRSRSCAGYTGTHLFGSSLILLGCVLGLFPSILYISDSSVVGLQSENQRERMVQSAWNTIVFAVSFVPAAASQLVKEQTLMDYRQSIDDNQLNFTLNAGQFVLVGIMAPLLYPLEGLAAGSHWIQKFPARDTSVNFLDGMLCFVGALDAEDASHRYADSATCGPLSSVLVLAHVGCTLLMTHAIYKIVIKGGGSTRCYQSMIAGTVIGGLFMWLYGCLFRYRNVETGIGLDGRHIVDILHVSSFLVLLSGLEIYHRRELPDIEFETMYPDAESLEEDESQ